MLDKSIEDMAAVAGHHVVASLTITSEERDKGSITAERVTQCTELFEAQGYIRLVDLFDHDQMRRWQEFYFERYAWYTNRTRAPDRRPIVSVAIEGPFNDVNLLRNPILDQIISALIGPKYILGALGSVISFPGAPDQVLHRDSTTMFGEDNETDKDMPFYSFNMLAPLVDCTAETGRTRLWPGTHHIATVSEGLAVGSLDPDVSVGSVLLTDGRLLHRGAANRSEIVRPLLYYSYQRRWYQDQFGYNQRPRVMISPAEFAKMPTELQEMLAWTQQNFRKIRMKHAVLRVLPPALVKRIAAVV
jgi:ectoine hydroxylase-related dioxygenase (phytanoyl-CoA dioxygenase family)